jgi:uncharacterized protein (DUF1778 family)
MPTNSIAAKEDRLSVRVPKEVKNNLIRAAALRGITLSNFIVANMEPIAETVIQEYQSIKLSTRDQVRLMDALNNPPKPNKALIEAIQDYENAVLSGEITVED